MNKLYHPIMAMFTGLLCSATYLLGMYSSTTDTRALATIRAVKEDRHNQFCHRTCHLLRFQTLHHVHDGERLICRCGREVEGEYPEIIVVPDTHDAINTRTTVPYQTRLSERAPSASESDSLYPPQ